MSEYVFTKDELYHHGIKGQKWGIRNFQNPDGTYTDIGKARRRIGDGDPTGGSDKKKKKVSAEQMADSAFRPGKEGKASKAEKVANKTTEAARQVQDIETSWSKRKARDKIDQREKEIESMTDSQLRQKIERHRLENEYRKVIEEEETLKQGESKVKEYLDVALPAMELTASAVAIFATIWQITHGK